MGHGTKHFRHESLQDAKTIKSLLTSLSKGFSKGEMVLGDDDDELVLKTDGLLTVKIKAEREGGQCQVLLQINWSDPTETKTSKGTPRIES